MKNIFLIGDSIRQGYQPQLAEIMKNELNICYPHCCMSDEKDDNSRWTGYTLNNLVAHLWLKDLPKISVIHWNNGIWDAVIRHEEDGPFTPLDDYEKNVRRILRELKKLSPNIIFATTTPPKTDKLFNDNTKKLTLDINDIKDRNKIIVKVASENNIEINDLFDTVFKEREKYTCEDNIHLSEEGKKICANQVAECIRKYL